MSKALRILILEDQPADAELITRELRKAGLEFVAKTIATEHEFLAELEHSAPQVILADYTLPAYDGLSALAAAQKRCPETPFILITGSLGEDKAIETLQRGATDYVLKDRLARLGPAVRRALREQEERRKAAKERHESEEQFRAIFDLASIGMAQADPRTGQWLRVNQKMCAITGYSAAELLGMRVPEITHPGDRQKDWDAFQRVVRGETSDYRLEKRYLCKDGAVAWVNVNMTVIQDAAGQPVRTIATIEDITERKRAEESLRESERRYRMLFNSGYDAVFVHQGGSGGNAPGKFIEVNDIACQQLGYTRAELLQLTPHDISAPETLSDIPGIRATLAVEKSAISEGVHLTKNGRRIPVEISTHVFELNGKPTRLSMVRDITERKRAEAHLHLLSEALESAANAIVITDCGGNITWANEAFTSLSGYALEEAIGRKPNLLKSGKHDQAFYQQLWETILAGQVWSAEMTNRRKDGSLYTEENTITPVRNEKGEITHFIAVKQDITERKRAERRIAAFANLGQRLNSANTARAAAEIIVGAADELLGWDACLFDLYSATEDRLSHLLSMDLIDGRRTECNPRHPNPLPRGFSRRAIDQGGQLILRGHLDAVGPEGVPFGEVSRPSASLMFVPIRHGTQVVGVLSIQSYTPKAYDAHSLETLQALADYGGGALERLRTQEALGESEANFRSVWEHSIDGMRLTDKAGRIIAVNEAFCRLVKLPRKRLEGQIFSVAYEGHSPTDGIELYLKRFAAGDIVPHLTTRARLWDGVEADLEISNSFIELAQRGKMLLSIFRDVSQRKRAELRVEAFSQLGQRLSAASSPAEAARAIYASADVFWKWDCGVLDLELPESGRMETALAYDVVNGQRREVTPPDPVGPASAMIRRVMARGAELILRKPEELAATDTIRFGDASRLSASIMCVPVRVENRAVGVLSIQSYTPDAYTREDLQTLQALANHCGGALDRLRIGKALYTSEARYRRLFESAKDGILILDAETGRIVDVNPFLVKLLGFSHQSFLGKRVWELGFFKDIIGNEAKFAELQQNCHIRYEDMPLETSGGRRIEVEFVSNVYEVNHQKVIQCNIRDISLRKRAEMELKRSHEQYRHAIAAANAIPYQKMYGAETYVFMGEGIKELTGYAPNELLSKVWSEIILETVFMGEAAGLPLAEAARRTLAGEIKHWRADHRIRTRGGAIRWISDSSVQLFDADGKLIGSMGIIQDITERKELEAQLRQAQKMDAVGQLAGGVAHDFNNMLAVIRGNAELLLMEEAQDPAETKEGLRHVVEASERAANLTRQLLAFSRKQVLQPQPLMLNEVIANLTRMLNRVISENITLQCDYAATLPYVQADTGMMEQVILNLVVNARDAMPEGGQLRIRTEQLRIDAAHARAYPEAHAGEFVCLLVSDTGTGIAPEVLPRIFEPFFTTKEVGKGTGLGLATVYGIVKQHEGWLEVSSQVGEGSTFKVFLPAIPSPTRLAAAAEAGAEVRGGTETILVAEDDHAVRLATRRVLERNGYKILEATSAQEALEQWRNHAAEIALLVTDIVMPGEMTGRDLAEQLWGERPGLKVIFMSGYSAEVVGKDTDFIRRTKSYFLRKPCSAQALTETVRRSLDTKEPPPPPDKAGGAK